MSGKNLVIVLLSAFFLFTCSSATAAVYSEDWNDGTLGGWVVATDASISNPGTYLRVDSESQNARMHPHIWDSMIPLEITSMDMVEFDARLSAGSYTGFEFRVRRSDAENGWHYEFSDGMGADWDNFSLSWDPNWGNTDAQNNGWDQESGAADFSLVMNSVEDFGFVIWGASSDAQVEFDNFQAQVELAQTVPVPAAIWLLGSGLIGLIGLRRRLV